MQIIEFESCRNSYWNKLRNRMITKILLETLSSKKKKVRILYF